MRVCHSVLLLVLASVFCAAQNSRKDELVTFAVLKNGKQKIATIKVPAGYKEETTSYVEGVQTILKYPDGSYIILHVGGMIKLPFFTEPEHEVFERQQLSNRMIKRGKVRNTELFWREENSIGVWPPTNIGFTNVPKDRLKLFEKSIRSFVRAK